MSNITQIDIRKINANGRYVDLTSSTILDLTDEQILTLREYYNDNSIAANRQIRKYYESPRRQSSYETSRVSPSRKNTPQYRVTRDQKYNNSRHHTKRPPKNNLGKIIVVGSLVVCVVLGGRALTNNLGQAIEDVKINPSYTSSIEHNSTPDNLNEYIHNDASSEENIPMEEYGTEQVSPVIEYLEKSQERMEQENQSERELLIQDICNIYQVDYNTVYQKLVELTDNFSSEDYLNGTIKGVTCKGIQVENASEEELLIYAIRCIKQLPENLSVNRANLYIDNGYKSGTDYNNQLSRVGEVLGVDRCLLYAIVQSETSFNSPLFNESNNPAGIKAPDGSWWVFDTKEEGFFELGMELLKYYRKIGVTPDNIDYQTLSQIRDIHAPLIDNNDTWLPNVTSNLEYAKLHEAELFGTYEQNNGLSM